MKTSENFNGEHWKAYSNTQNLWNQTFVNGEYIIAYEFDPSLDQKLIDMLPTVCSWFRSIWYLKHLLFAFLIKAMQKIEQVTCIKFEKRSQNLNNSYSCLIWRGFFFISNVNSFLYLQMGKSLQFWSSYENAPLI